MLIIGLIAAICFYVLLYLLYHAAETQISGFVPVLSTVMESLLVPEPEIFFLLRGLIVITLFYVIADAVISPARRGLKKQKQKRLDAEREKVTFRGVKTQAPPPEEDDDSLEHPNLAPPRFSS